MKEFEFRGECSKLPKAPNEGDIADTIIYVYGNGCWNKLIDPEVTKVEGI